MTRSLCSGAMPTNAAMTSRATCGFCVVFHSVKLLGAGVVFADRRARLDRVRHQAVVDDVELGDVLGRLERGVDRFGVAEMPLIDRVVRRDLVDLRRAWRLRLAGIGHRRQHLVIDFDLFGGIARLRQRFGDHHRHRIADMAGLADGERRMRRHLHRRAVLGMDHPAADQIADLVGGQFGAGEHREHARHAGAAGVDRFDLGVRVRRAHEIGVGLAGPIDVVGVVALAGNEALILLAAHCGADTGRTHGFLPVDRECVRCSIRRLSACPRRRPWPCAPAASL